MIASGPRIDPHKLYTREELEELLPASLLRLIIRQAATIDGLLSGRQVGHLVQVAFEAVSHVEERSPSTSPVEKNTYLTISHVAEILKSSPREITRLVDAGKLRAIDLNEGMGKRKRALRIRREWIDDLEARLALQSEEQPKSKFRFAAAPNQKR